MAVLQDGQKVLEMRPIEIKYLDKISGSVLSGPNELPIHLSPVWRSANPQRSQAERHSLDIEDQF